MELDSVCKYLRLSKKSDITVDTKTQEPRNFNSFLNFFANISIVKQQTNELRKLMKQKNILES